MSSIRQNASEEPVIQTMARIRRKMHFMTERTCFIPKVTQKTREMLFPDGPVIPIEFRYKVIFLHRPFVKDKASPVPGPLTKGFGIFVR